MIIWPFDADAEHLHKPYFTRYRAVSEEYNLNPVRGLIMLFVVSYLIHATLLVNSADSELRNAQQQVGKLLTEQLAANSATLMMNKDTIINVAELASP